MEIIFGLIVIGVLGYVLFYGNPFKTMGVPSKLPVSNFAPYKVETPAVEDVTPVTESTPVETAPAKKPRKPRATKTTSTAKVSKPVKKAAPKKASVKKATQAKK